LQSNYSYYYCKLPILLSKTAYLLATFALSTLFNCSLAMGGRPQWRLHCVGDKQAPDRGY